ncbi:MAG: sugar ABC transporter substrate-binding protein [Armatimonadetes bacterium]|nr:sugar ABC transporter substrate-binding protein [Armatimonadota bacterium]
MTKSRLALCLILPILLSMLCGCVQKKEESEVVHLRMVVWGSAADEQKWNDKLKRFYEAHPDVKVRLEYIVNERTLQKLLIATAGNKAPDASVISSMWFVPAASKGLLEDLGPYVAKDRDFDLSDFYPQVVEGWGKYRGKLYAIPAGVDVTAMYYNKTMFDRYNVPYPDETWGWDDYLAAARKLTLDTNGDGKLDQWGTSQNWWQSYVWANGGEIISEDKTRCLLDQPEAIEGLQWMADLRNKYHVAPTAKDMADISSVKMFTNGQTGMYFSGSWAVPLYFDKDIKGAFEYDVAPVPKGPVCRATFYGGASYAVLRGSKHKQLAWELVKFMVSKEALRERAIKEQVIPSRMSVAKSNAFLDLPGPPRHRKVFLDAIEYGRTLPRVPCSEEMNSIIGNELNNLQIGTETAESACKRTAKRVNGLLWPRKNRE